MFPVPIILDTGALIARLRKPVPLEREANMNYTVVVPRYNGYPVQMYNGANLKVAYNGKTKPEAVKHELGGVLTKYTVIMDADTMPEADIAQIIATLEKRDADIASVIVLPYENHSLLQKLQEVEYSIAMKIRRLSPYLTSGACIVGKTEVLKKIMERHTLEWEGEDLEVGLLAKKLGYKIIHIDAKVRTRVPTTLKGLLKQRAMWTRGMLRLSRKYFKQFAPHALYGIIVFLALTPLKVVSLLTSWLIFPVVYLCYALLTLACATEGKTYIKLLYPLYALFMSIATPIAVALTALKRKKH